MFRHAIISLKALILLVSTQRVGATLPNQTDHLDCAANAQLADASLHSAVAAEFAQSFNIRIDWNEVLQVSDDEEGSNCLFSDDRGHVVRVPVEIIRTASPNKYGGAP